MRATRVLIEHYNGYKEWFINGLLHRTDGPAQEWNNESKGWYLNGELHRTDGPAIDYYDGSKEWYINGKLHRTDGPAHEEEDGTKGWYINGKLHRTDGPAFVYSDGTKEWYINDIKYNEKEYKENKEKNRKLSFKYFHLWYDKLDDPNREIGKKRMNKIYDNMIKEGLV